MILSDRSIREQLDAGRIVIEPLDPKGLQPSSVDLRLDRWFRVFRNHMMSHIDVKANLEELTQLVEVAEDDVGCATYLLVLLLPKGLEFEIA